MSGSEHTKERGADLHAVLIGINDYATSGCKSLLSSVNDAALLYDLFRRTWSNPLPALDLLVNPLPDASVHGKSALQAHVLTRRRILAAIANAAQRTGENSTLVVYFAGHGMLDQQARLCLLVNSEEAGRQAFLRLDEIIDAAGACPARKRLIILDCCQTHTSDDVTRAQSLDYIQSLVDQEWVVWMSCSPGEVAVEPKSSLRFGGFVERLVAGVSSLSRPEGAPVDLLSLASIVSGQVRDRIRLLPVKALVTRTGDGFAASNEYLWQRPLLMSPPIAAGGPLQFTFAQQALPSKRSLRRRTPSTQFPAHFVRCLRHPWPVTIPYLFWNLTVSRLLYGLVIATSALWFSPFPRTAPSFAFAAISGIATYGFYTAVQNVAVAANEDYWHAGGWVTTASLPGWGMLFALVCWLLNPGVDVRALLVDTYWLSFLIFLYGLNAFQTFVGFAETLRNDLRGDPGHLGRTFGQYEQAFNLDFDNVLSTLALQAPVYWGFLGFSLAGLAALELGTVPPTHPVWAFSRLCMDIHLALAALTLIVMSLLNSANFAWFKSQVLRARASAPITRGTARRRLRDS